MATVILISLQVIWKIFHFLKFHKVSLYVKYSVLVLSFVRQALFLILLHLFSLYEME